MASTLRWFENKPVMMEGTENKMQPAQQGSGSAENKGQDRDARQNSKTVISDQERQNLAAQLGEGPNAVVGLKDLGALSGRDDAAGGSGDGMESQNTGDATDR
jgi:hypothetical protein